MGLMHLLEPVKEIIVIIVEIFFCFCYFSKIVQNYFLICLKVLKARTEMAKMIRLKSTSVNRFLLGIFRNCMYLLVRIGLPLSGIAFNQKTTLTQSVIMRRFKLFVAII